MFDQRPEQTGSPRWLTDSEAKTKKPLPLRSLTSATLTVVYSFPAVLPGLFDPEVGIDFARLVHGGQEFEWPALVIAGDEITTSVTLKDVSTRAGMAFYVFESVSTNQRDETVCIGLWTDIVREAAS